MKENEKENPIEKQQKRTHYSHFFIFLPGSVDFFIQNNIDSLTFRVKHSQTFFFIFLLELGVGLFTSMQGDSEPAALF